MKALVLISSLLLATSAFAGTRVGSVTFQKSSAWIPANYLCIDNGYIVKSNGKQTVLVSKCADNYNGSCEMVAKTLYPQPVVSTFVRYENCSGDSDTNCTAVEYQVDQSTVPVYKSNGGDSENEEIVGSYSIPACKMSPLPPVPAN